MAPKKTQTTTAPVAATEPVAAKVVSEPVPETPAVVADDVDQFVAVLEKLQGFAADIKDVITKVKTLQKEYNKVKNQKTSRKVKKAAGAASGRAPSGFAKPTGLSDQLCEFLGIAKGSSQARTEVTRTINAYVKTHKLQDPADKRRILPDAKLSSILTLGPEDKLTYFNLQSFMKPHFIKASA